MINEEICTHEVAKLAEEKGFPLQKVIKQDGRAFFYELPQSHPDWADCNAWYLPTQSLLQRWLREEKGYAISVTAYPTLARLNKVCYVWEIKSNSDGISMKSVDSEYTFSTYELALEDAELYCLKNLVI
jgi:hypothetical protein